MKLKCEADKKSSNKPHKIRTIPCADSELNRTALHRDLVSYNYVRSFLLFCEIIVMFVFSVYVFSPFQLKWTKSLDSLY